MDLISEIKKLGVTIEKGHDNTSFVVSGNNEQLHKVKDLLDQNNFICDNGFGLVPNAPESFEEILVCCFGDSPNQNGYLLLEKARNNMTNSESSDIFGRLVESAVQCAMGMA